MRLRTLRFALLVIGWLMLSGQAAWAGAWPRDPGTWFATAATRLAWPQSLSDWQSAAPTQDYQTLYLEYGLTPRWTLGLDLGRSVSGADKTIGFARVALPDGPYGAKLSTQLGIGALADAAVVRPGLSIGWGVESGWIAIDAVAEMVRDQGTDWKLDVTWGRKRRNDHMVILQIQMGAPARDPAFARLAPSYVWPTSTRYMLEAGVTYGLRGDSSMGIKLGVWAHF